MIDYRHWKNSKGTMKRERLQLLATEISFCVKSNFQNYILVKTATFTSKYLQRLGPKIQNNQFS